jgi:hypothetical protein
MLEYAALIGSPMRPDEIQKVLREMNKAHISHVITDDESDKCHGV